MNADIFDRASAEKRPTGDGRRGDTGCYCGTQFVCCAFLTVSPVQKANGIPDIDDIGQKAPVPAFPSVQRGCYMQNKALDDLLSPQCCLIFGPAQKQPVQVKL